MKAFKSALDRLTGAYALAVLIGRPPSQLPELATNTGLIPLLDQGLAALIHDLHERGRLQETLVVFLTEFGRTPLETGAALAAAGIKIVIWPVSSLRIEAKALT